MNVVRTALNIGSLLLVVALSYLIVRIILGVLRPDSLYAPQVIVEPSAINQTMSGVRDYDFSSDPFRLDAPVIEIDPGLDAPETTLNLAVKGITTGKDDGGAILRLPDGKDKRVAIGSEVMDNVTLVSVEKGFIILNVGGELQRLTYADTEESSLIMRPDNVVPTFATSMSGGSSMNVTTSPEDFLSKVAINPQRDNGRVIGYRVTPRGNTDLSAYGLKAGDTLTRIGTVDLQVNRVDFRQLRSIFSSSTATRGVDVQILRDGQPVTLRIGN